MIDAVFHSGRDRLTVAGFEMLENFRRRYPDLGFALVVLLMAAIGGFGLAALRYAIEIATR